MTVGKGKRPRDPNQLAKLIVDIATGEAEDTVSEAKRHPRDWPATRVMENKPQNRTEQTGKFGRFTEFLKRLVRPRAEKSILEVDREGRKREREKAAARRGH
jgi:hypothetical protein